MWAASGCAVMRVDPKLNLVVAKVAGTGGTGRCVLGLAAPWWWQSSTRLGGTRCRVAWWPMTGDHQLQDRPHRKVVRIGDTVRRPVQPWTPAVHALLRHLETVAFTAAPRVLGFDEEGRWRASRTSRGRACPQRSPTRRSSR